MKINIVALGNKLPTWINTGFDQYAKRISSPWSLSLQEIPIPRRHKNANIPVLKDQEGQALLAASHHCDIRVALDEHGKSFNTSLLAQYLDQYQQQYRSIAILIGGPDGLSEFALQTCHQRWSLSQLTLPHGLVRCIIAEQIYRAISVLNHHPYHRE